ncbi:MAG: phosphotransferase [Woeseiaceae bacterium]
MTAHSAVAEEPPCIDAIDVARAVKEQFGLDGKYSPLISERDQNFHLKTSDGSQYVVKVTSSAEAAIVSKFHIDTLLHLERAATIRVPRVIRTTDGQSCGRVDRGERSYVLRVVGYLEGELLESTVIDAHVARDFGTNLARLDAALQGFAHEGESPVLLWDMQRAGELRNLLNQIDDQAVRRPVAGAIDDFDRFVVPKLDSLRSQVIHGDANPGNVLVDSVGDSLWGFIDFGDIVKAPMVVDVAIAASYLRAGSHDALRLISPFVAGYCAVLPLYDEELAFLFDLVRTRLATTITILYWRLNARDEDDPYRQKALASEGDAIRFLNALDALGRDRFLQGLQRN